MKIKEINQSQRPKERLIQNGINTLSDYELLAIILNTGTKEEGVLELSCKLLNNYNLLEITYDELIKIKGIKKSKATKILSFIELTKRLISKSVNTKKIDLSDSLKIYKYTYLKFLNLKTEILLVLFLDVKLNLIFEKVFEQFNESKISFDIKEIIKIAILKNSKNIILIHNHPSGNSNPSKIDIENTLNIESIFRSFDINLLDHIIIGHRQYYSINFNKINFL